MIPGLSEPSVPGAKALRQPNRIATSWSGVMGTTCKQRQPLVLIGADKWRSDRGGSDGVIAGLSLQRQSSVSIGPMSEWSALNRVFVQRKHSITARLLFGLSINLDVHWDSYGPWSLTNPFN